MKGTCLITGASSGIGAALARKFADQEFNLIISGRDETALDEVRQTFSNPDNAQIVTADLSTPDGVSHLIAEVEKLPLTVDILVNNAGILLRGNLNDHSIEDIENLLHVNMQSLTRLTHHFLTGMITRDCGRILNVASVAAFQPIPSMDIYAAKQGLCIVTLGVIVRTATWNRRFRYCALPRCNQDTINRTTGRRITLPSCQFTGRGGGRRF